MSRGQQVRIGGVAFRRKLRQTLALLPERETNAQSLNGEGRVRERPSGLCGILAGV
jgi:hypothetical protein